MSMEVGFIPFVEFWSDVRRKENFNHDSARIMRKPKTEEEGGQ